MKTKIFYDFEATSVARDADPISVGLLAVTGDDVKTFYAEFTDFNPAKADEWVKENIIDSLLLDNIKHGGLYENDFKENSIVYKQTHNAVSWALREWLSQFEEVEFWADFDVIDAPMLIDLITTWDIVDYVHPKMGHGSKHKIGLPQHLPNIRYDQFFDIHTLLKDRDVDTDINREIYAFGERIPGVPNVKNKDQEITELGLTPSKHNALWDAYVNWKCFLRLT